MRQLRIGKLIESLPRFSQDPLPLEGRFVRDNWLEILLLQIPKREAFIIERLIGNDWPISHIALELKVSRKRIYQLKKQAFRHLNAIAKIYAPFFKNYE